MKQLLTLTLLIVSMSGFAQLKRITVDPPQFVGKAQQFGGPLEAECTKRGNTYTIRYRQNEDTGAGLYHEMIFEDIENTFEDLYAVMLEGFETMPADAIMLELPEFYIWLKFEKSLGIPVVTITSSYSKDPYAPLYMSNQIAKKQIQKLFGKR